MINLFKMLALVLGLGGILTLMVWGVSHDAEKRNLMPPDTICTNYKVVSYYEKVDDTTKWVGPETHVLCIISMKELEEVSQ